MTKGQWSRHLRGQRLKTERTDEQREKKREYARRSREKNRLKINERQREKQKELRDLRKERGVCMKCDGDLGSLKHVVCGRCRLLQRVRYWKLKEEKNE